MQLSNYLPAFLINILGISPNFFFIEVGNNEHIAFSNPDDCISYYSQGIDDLVSSPEYDPFYELPDQTLVRKVWNSDTKLYESVYVNHNLLNRIYDKCSIPENYYGLVTSDDGTKDKRSYRNIVVYYSDISYISVVDTVANAPPPEAIIHPVKDSEGFVSLIMNMLKGNRTSDDL